MALVYSLEPAAVAAGFTSNRVQAAPVKLCRSHLAHAFGQAVIINSGNANACTGPEGEKNALAMAEATAKHLQLPREAVFVCSTGTIGRPMPMNVILPGIKKAVGSLSAASGSDAARAIMTTDTVPKQTSVDLKMDGKTVTIGAMAKGSGMIAPDMATMLAFITTDALIEPQAWRELLREAAEQSFNCITVDGDQSTNDTVICFANGLAGNHVLHPQHAAWHDFKQAFFKLTLDLALMIVKDGEGATKLVTVRVRNAASHSAAKRVARAVAESLLVKTSWFGSDPNWGRVICAAGYSGVSLDPDLIDIIYDGKYAVRGGQPAGLPEGELHAVIDQPEFTLELDLHQGSSSATIYSSDCSDQYVAINASYMT